MDSIYIWTIDCTGKGTLVWSSQFAASMYVDQMESRVGWDLRWAIAAFLPSLWTESSAASSFPSSGVSMMFDTSSRRLLAGPLCDKCMDQPACLPLPVHQMYLQPKSKENITTESLDYRKWNLILLSPVQMNTYIWCFLNTCKLLEMTLEGRWRWWVLFEKVSWSVWARIGLRSVIQTLSIMALTQTKKLHNFLKKTVKNSWFQLFWVCPPKREMWQNLRDDSVNRSNTDHHVLCEIEY